MAEHHKTCAHCGAGFVAKNRNRFLCSGRCKRARYNAANRHLINQKQSVRNRSEAAKVARDRYRSKVGEASRKQRDAAKQASLLERQAQVAARAALKQMWADGIIKKCATCGTEFMAHAPWGAYCKRNCRPSKRESDRRRWNELLAAGSALRLLRVLSMGDHHGND